MTKQHTPGPWVLDDKTRAVTWGDVSFSAPFGAGGFVIASHSVSTLPTYQSDRLTPEHHANARLIEAAPEMWDLIVELFEDPKLSLIIGGNPNQVSAVMERADKLRAKVRGTQ